MRSHEYQVGQGMTEGLARMRGVLSATQPKQDWGLAADTATAITGKAQHPPAVIPDMIGDLGLRGVATYFKLCA